MSARHVLSEDQFIPITQLRDMQAGDYQNGVKVGDLHRGYSIYDKGYKWDSLHKDLDQGMDSPLEVHQHGDRQVLDNGHHRAVAAMERGMMFVPIRETDPEDSDPGTEKYRNEGAWGAGSSAS